MGLTCGDGDGGDRLLSNLCFRFLAAVACQSVDLTKFASASTTEQVFRIDDITLSAMLKITMRMLDHIDVVTQRQGAQILSNIVEVVSDTSLRWHGPKVLWTLR